jgi:hypothetical protein
LADQVITVTVPSTLLATSSIVTNNPTITVKATPEAKLSGTITSSTSESSIASGGKTIIISLTNATWNDIVTDATNREDFFNSLNGTISSETAEWGKVITALKAAAPASVLTLSADSRTVTVTLPAVPDYNISADQSIDINFDSTLCTADPGCTATITENFAAFTITSTKTIATIGGTAVPATTEAAINTGSKTIIITLSGGNPWVTDIVSTTEKKELLLNSITAVTEADVWKGVITGSAVTLDPTETIITITLPVAADYNISADQKITVNIPPVLLADSSVPVSNTLEFTIKATPEATLSGSIISSTSESNIMSGGKTIIISLTNATWTGNIINIAQTRDTFFDSLNGTITPPAEAAEWVEVITALKAAPNPASVISLSSDKRTVTVTLPAVPGYNISSPQSIDITFDNTLCIVDSGLTDPITESFAAFTIAPASSTATLGGNIATASETDIRSGGRTILLTLTDNTWTADSVSNTAKLIALIDGFTTATDTTAWNAVKAALKTSGGVVRTSDTLLTITLPAVAGYDIAADQTVNLNIPTTLLTNSYTVNSLSFTITADKAATVTGTATPTLTEADIAAGGKTVIITLTNDTWKSDIVTETAKREAIINAFTANPANTEWDEAVAAMKASAVLTRNSDKVLTITLPSVKGFNISADLKVDFDVPAAAITSGADLPALATVFTVAPVTSQTAALSGTITSASTESDIRTGGKTVIVTLSNDIWSANVATDPAVRNALLSGFAATGTVTDSAQWNNFRTALIAAYATDPTTVVRTSDTVVTIKLPAVAGFGIGEDIAVKLTIPSNALTTANTDVLATPSFTISAIAATLSGTTVTSVLDSTVIQKGGKTIIITLNNAKWVTDAVSDEAKLANLIAGFVADTNTAEWDEVKNAILADPKNVTRSSDTVVKITLPAVPGYTASSQTVSLTIQSHLLTGSPEIIVASPSLNIGALATAALTGSTTLTEQEVVTGGKSFTITLANGAWAADVASSSSKKNNLLKGFVAATDTNNWSKVITALKAGAGSIVRTSDAILTINLPPVSDYDIITNQTVNITIPKAVLTQSSIDVTAATPLTITIPAYAGKGALEENLANGSLANLMETVPLKQIMITAPKKYVSSVTINNSVLVNASITSVDVLTDTDVATVKASAGGADRTATAYTLTDGMRKFNLGFAGLETGADVIISALDGSGNKLQSDIALKIPSSKKSYSFAPKTSLSGSYSLYQLLNTNSLLKNITKYYSLSDLTVSTP